MDFFGFKVCRIPYSVMKSKKNSFNADSKHIVYILYGKNEKGEECLYVGKSSRGTKNRPTDHEDLEVDWIDCFIMTASESNNFNGGMAEYMEHRIKCLADESERYVDKTKTTTEVNSNDTEKKKCESLMPATLEMLNILGIQLMTRQVMDMSQFTSSPEPAKTGSGVDSSDYSSMHMGGTIENWLTTMEIMVKTIDPSAETIIKLDSKYVAFKIGKKTMIRCYPKKDEPRIDVFFLGSPDDYADSRIVQRPENRHDKPLDSMFVVRNDEDLKYFQIFAQKAINML